jgi:hypothetical protein
MKAIGRDGAGAEADVDGLEAGVLDSEVAGCVCVCVVEVEGGREGGREGRKARELLGRREGKAGMKEGRREVNKYTKKTI